MIDNTFGFMFLMVIIIGCIFVTVVMICSIIENLWDWSIKNSKPVNDEPYDDLFKTPEIEYPHKDGRN